MRSRAPDRVRLESERLVLRVLHRGDEVAIARFYTENQAFLQPYAPTFGQELFSVRGWRDRIEAIHAEYRHGRALRLVLIAKEDPARIIGVANFTMITGFPTFLCNLGYSIAESEQGKGLMTEGLGVAIAYVFREVGLHRIEANYMPSNTRSARVLEKLGFTIEGQASRYILINGRWEDHVRTSLTNPDWHAAP
ncbi:MAG TPA: GNAT family N-acetyltransferase [Fimbriimonadaceae bacterium]|nr:GNAT family N-acetyltransferase [Fimbriimonadaceae bacterium]